MKLRKIFYIAISSTLLAALSTCIYPEVSKVEIYAAEYSDNWKLNSDNNWEYYKNGNKLISTWVQDNNNWYLLDKDGVMRVGLYESYGKYYLLDDVRGTGTYGKLLKNGATYKGINISADTSSEYEGALSEDTLNRLSGVGLSKNSAANVSGTAHNTNDVNKQQAIDKASDADNGYSGDAANEYIFKELRERDQAQLEMAIQSGLGK